MTNYMHLLSRVATRTGAVSSPFRLAVASQLQRRGQPMLWRTYSTDDAKAVEPEPEKHVTSNKNENDQTKGTESVEKQLAAQEKQLAELKNNYLRALAETENVRQQMRRQVEETAQFAIRKFAKDMLDTVDILGMALRSVPKEKLESSDVDGTLKNLHVGVSMTESELLRALKRHGVEPYDPIDQVFDPNLHQAAFQVAIPGKKPGTVFQVEKRGFMIKDRVLRPAQVGVVKDES
ncbi:GrpE-domain-containing protein [Syncephalis plumigaleata]|nr:GrpE-domain-containing protein [Syncephalis plumigaleata]